MIWFFGRTGPCLLIISRTCRSWGCARVRAAFPFSMMSVCQESLQCTDIRRLQVCFSANYGSRNFGQMTGYCSIAEPFAEPSDDEVLYRTCNADLDCVGGGVCMRACITLQVQRCRYCVQDSDTLRNVVGGRAGGFGIDTNWLVSDICEAA